MRPFVAQRGCIPRGPVCLIREHQVMDEDFAAYWDQEAATFDQARHKAANRTDLSFRLGDAASPPLPSASYDVVLSRHVLWVIPDPAESLRLWCDLLTPTAGWC
jgi:SAM-dependent methyltransferase